MWEEETRVILGVRFGEYSFDKLYVRLEALVNPEALTDEQKKHPALWNATQKELTNAVIPSGAEQVAGSACNNFRADTGEYVVSVLIKASDRPKVDILERLRIEWSVKSLICA